MPTSTLVVVADFGRRLFTPGNDCRTGHVLCACPLRSRHSRGVLLRSLPDTYPVDQHVYRELGRGVGCSGPVSAYREVQ